MSSSLPRAPLFTRTDFDLRGRGAMDAELHDRLEGWAKRVTVRLRDLGLAMESAVVDGRAGPPGVVFVRDGRERDRALRAARAHKLDFRPLFAGVFAENAKLVLRLTHATVEARLELPATALVDLHNLRAKLANPEGILSVTSAVEALPEQFWGGLENGSQGPVSRVGGAEFRAWLDEAWAAGPSACIFFGWTLPKDIAVSQKSDLAEQLEDAISALGGLYDVVAWSELNDFLGSKRRVGPVSEREAAPKGRHARKNGKKPRRKIDDAARTVDDDAEALVADDAAPQGPESREGRAPALFRRPVLRRALRVTDVDPRLPIEKGTRIRVLAGPFSGKVGIVQELDGKGSARVLFGLLAARLRVSDLVACTAKSNEKKGARQKLMSSHRKPLNQGS